MTGQAWDYRFKVIHFPQEIAGMQVASLKDILWPCHAFAVSIPSKPKKILNIFEETILRLSAIQKGDTLGLAETTCLELEIVSFIQNRLNQMGYLSDRFEITEAGTEIIQCLDKESTEYIAATVYVDLIGGRILPVITVGQARFENVMNVDNHKVKFTIGTVGKKKRTCTARYLCPCTELHSNIIPSSDQVARTIKSFHRLYKRYKLLNKNISKPPLFLPVAEAITVQPMPDLIFLHCRVIVQKGHPDFIVTDGFGYGTSTIFRDCLEKMNEDWLIGIKKRALQEKLMEAGPNGHNVSLPTFSERINQYNDIKKHLEHAESNWQISKGNFATALQQTEIENAAKESIKSLYDALEWTLRQVVTDYPSEVWERCLAEPAMNYNNSLLVEMARKVGFRIDGEEAQILQAIPGKIRALSNGETELQPLLAVAVAEASENKQHPVNNLARNDQYCISFIAKIKKLRDPAAHGGTIDPSLILNKLDYYRDNVHKIIKYLYPIFQPTDFDFQTTYTENNLEDSDQQRLQARINLESYFGISAFKSLPGELRNELDNIELYFQNSNHGSSYGSRCINSFASSLQIIIYEALKEHHFNVDKNADFIQIAQEKALNANFKLNQGKLPASISRVNPKRIIHACAGFNVTIGANLVAFLNIVPVNTLEIITGIVPEMVIIVGEIAEIRGHGNKTDIDLPREKLLALRSQTFKIIKCLLEV